MVSWKIEFPLIFFVQETLNGHLQVLESQTFLYFSDGHKHFNLFIGVPILKFNEIWNLMNPVY